MKFFRRIRAWLDSVPFRLERFWPYWYAREPILAVPGSSSTDLVRAVRRWEVGAVVALFDRGGYRYFYRIVESWRIPGDDHVAAPWEYDLEYEGCERLP